METVDRVIKSRNFNNINICQNYRLSEAAALLLYQKYRNIKIVIIIIIKIVNMGIIIITAKLSKYRHYHYIIKHQED